MAVSSPFLSPLAKLSIVPGLSRGCPAFLARVWNRATQVSRSSPFIFRSWRAVTAHCLSVVLVNAVVKVFLKLVQRISWSQVKPPAGDSLLQSSSIWACTQSSTLGPLISNKAKLTRRYGLWNISLFSFMFQRMSNSCRKVLVLVLSPSVTATCAE